eukprot:TRINITY_DN285_c0_g2_i1.p1 TRINITY_DN285_c0_g2~~TRINITY_DN285_c0_g2_i1.p1  ORF type:complete len:173 (-),score=31.69 TRINITY_DN285_c0_g2_i1:69-587(-)
MDGMNGVKWTDDEELDTATNQIRPSPMSTCSVCDVRTVVIGCDDSCLGYHTFNLIAFSLVLCASIWMFVRSRMNNAPLSSLKAQITYVAFVASIVRIVGGITGLQQSTDIRMANVLTDVASTSLVLGLLLFTFMWASIQASVEKMKDGMKRKIRSFFQGMAALEVLASLACK